MWWFRTLAIVGVLALGPVGCGFTPLYGKTGAVKDRAVVERLAAVRVMPIEDRLGQQMRNALVERITPKGEPASPRYALKVTLSQSTSGTGYRKDAKATMGQMQLTASYHLTEDGRGVGGGNASSVVSFNFLGPRWGSVAAERDAEERAVSELADEILNQVALNISGLRRPVVPSGQP